MDISYPVENLLKSKYENLLKSFQRIWIKENALKFRILFHEFQEDFDLIMQQLNSWYDPFNKNRNLLLLVLTNAAKYKYKLGHDDIYSD